MKSRNTKPVFAGTTLMNLVALWCAFAVGGTQKATAQEKEVTPIPEEVGAEPTLRDFQELLSNSPFRRLLSLSDKLVLTGVARLPDGDVVTIEDQERNEAFSVSSEENAQGFRLLEIIPKTNIEEVSARIAIGKQEITVKFDPRRSTPTRRREKVEPGRIGEKPSAEQVLAALDPMLLEQFDRLEEPQQEQFRYFFDQYMEEYPGSSSELRAEYAREALTEIETTPLVSEGEEEVETDAAGESPAEGDPDVESAPEPANIPEPSE